MWEMDGIVYLEVALRIDGELFEGLQKGQGIASLLIVWHGFLIFSWNLRLSEINIDED